MKLSLCMIVKNEEEVLARCLTSVADLVDEIVIVDTGSSDATMKIAHQFTPYVHQFAWADDFAAARNHSFSLATGDYCMWLDADDVLEAVDRTLLANVKQNLLPETAVVMMKYNTGFDEQGNVTFSYFRERIIKNKADMCWKGAVHEVIEPKGVVVYSDCAITHRKLHTADPERNLRIFEKLLANGALLEPRQQFYYGRELYYHKRWREALAVLERFLDEKQGWLENNIDACCHCAYCYYGLGEQDAALLAFLRSFVFDLPRAEVCCEIGHHFIEREQYREAAYWYTLATACKRDDSRGGFTVPDCYDYLPCIQLCVCYSRMGKHEKAKRFNELAASFKPNAPAVLHNRAYFAK